MTESTSLRSRRTPYDDTYESCERTYAELRIYTGAMEPHLVTNRLGIAPTSTQVKGESKANSLGRVREVNLNGWFLSSDGKSSSMDVRRHLDWLLDKIEPVGQRILDLQEVAGVTMVVNCVWWSASGQGGPTLWPEQMQQLAGLNLECGFEIAFFGGEQ